VNENNVEQIRTGTGPYRRLPDEIQGHNGEANLSKTGVDSLFLEKQL